MLALSLLLSGAALGQHFDLAAYKAEHPERFQHEYTFEEIASYREKHPERFEQQVQHRQYSAAELAAYKAEHPERFDHRSHQHSVASIAAYKAEHPERFEHFDAEDWMRTFVHLEDGQEGLEPANRHHNYTSVELVIFAAGMAHAKQVDDYKKTHPEMSKEFSAEAIEAYKKAHPERIATAEAFEAYTKDQLDVFKAGFEHYNKVVAPYMAEHPDAFSASRIAEYIFEHHDRFTRFFSP